VIDVPGEGAALGMRCPAISACRTTIQAGSHQAARPHPQHEPGVLRDQHVAAASKTAGIIVIPSTRKKPGLKMVNNVYSEQDHLQSHHQPNSSPLGTLLAQDVEDGEIGDLW
jgi:hypothetical protein